MSGKTLKQEPHRRYYSEDFKREGVVTYEVSDKSRAEICRLLDISCSSLLQKWSLLYGKQRHPQKSNISMTKDKKTPASSSGDKTEEISRIANLEAEVKRLKKALGNHSVKDYLSELREEIWREISSEAALNEVERRVSKKL